MKMRDLPSDSRLWFFFPIIMPLTRCGDGPAQPSEIDKIVWEVWDIYCNVYGVFDYQPDAINKAIELNLKHCVKEQGKLVLKSEMQELPRENLKESK